MFARRRSLPTFCGLALGSLVFLVSGCASTLRTAVTLPFEVAGHTLDLAEKSLGVAAKAVDLAVPSGRDPVDPLDEEATAAEASE